MRDLALNNNIHNILKRKLEELDSILTLIKSNSSNKALNRAKVFFSSIDIEETISFENQLTFLILQDYFYLKVKESTLQQFLANTLKLIEKRKITEVKENITKVYNYLSEEEHKVFIKRRM